MENTTKWFFIAGLSIGLTGVCLAQQETRTSKGFEWADAEGNHTDLLFNGRKVVRYMHPTLDESTKESRRATYKPFHMVYDWEGRDFITKGAGGKYTHHRGIFYGFSKTRYTDADGKARSADIWHCKGKVYQSHEKVLKQEASDKGAVQKVQIDWHGVDGSVIATEERQLTFSRKNDDLVVDFYSKLTPKKTDFAVDGDPQHAGFQYRAHNDVSAKYAKQTYYIRPKTGKAAPGATINWSRKNDTEATRNLPWKGMSYQLGNVRYSVLYLDRPTNPKPARFSERNYGRFGSYFVAEATAEKPLEVNYRLVIRKGEYTPEECEEISQAYRR